jgi:hypothetical protein
MRRKARAEGAGTVAGYFGEGLLAQLGCRPLGLGGPSPGVGEYRADGAQLFIIPSLHMKVMQHTVKNRSKHKRRSDHDNQPGEDRVRAGKDFAGSGLELAEWPHAGEDHGCVHIRVRKRHALEVAITSHADEETAQGESAPDSNCPQHSLKKITSRNQLLAAMLQVDKAK